MAKIRKRRALATIVSTGILLSAVALLGSMLTAWSNSTFTMEKHEISKSYSEGVNKLNEYLTIENIWFGEPDQNQNPPIDNKFLNITLSNVGNIGLNVTKITLDNSIDKTNLIITDGGLARGKYYSTEIDYNWTNTEPIQITVTTEKGSIYQTYVMGP